MEHQNHHNPQGTQEDRLLPFDPIIVVRDVCKRWLVVVLAAMLVGIGAYIWADMNYSPVYTSTTTYVVTARGSSSSVYSSLSSTSTLAGIFEELLNSSLLRKTILEEIDADAFHGSISASVIAETNLINVKVTADDPRTAFLVSQAVIDHHEELTYKVLDSTSLEVLQAPSVPTGPSNSPTAATQMQKMSLIAATAAIALLAFLSCTRKAVRSEYEANKVLNCNCLGEIPHEKKRKTLKATLLRRKSSILITSPATSFRFVENFRKLRRRVERLMHDRQVIMVTSLLENEGKSTVAVNLAQALAQKHARVLLIDCDLRKPACHAILEQGDLLLQLHDVLTGKASLANATVTDKFSPLHLLLEKNAIHNSGDLIGSAEMKALLAQARHEYDYVVLDLPPMAAVSDAEGMMELADASLLVVRQNAAAAPAINKAIAALADGKAKLLGCVLNNVYSSRLTSGQSYGYGSRYGNRYGRYGHYGHYGHYGRYGAKKSE